MSDWVTVALIGGPILFLMWVVFTVSAMHKRDAYFWSLTSTWVSMGGGLFALVVFVVESNVVAYGGGPPAIVLGAVLVYAATVLYSGWYNMGALKNPLLALSVTMLQQLVLLTVIYVIARFTILSGERRQA